MSPKDKSNDAIDRDEWKDYNKTYTGKLTGFYYGRANGWLMDKDISYLKLSSGAKLSIEDFYPFEFDPTRKN
jgi:hypothetical protein